MEDDSKRKNKFQLFYAKLRTDFFNIMFELLKEKTTGLFFGCLMILIMFIQLIGLLFEPHKFHWKDEFFLTFAEYVCGYSRIISAINSGKSTFFYWALMVFAILYLVIMMALLIYMNYFLKNRKHYVENVVKVMRIMIVLMYWVFYMPFFEIFISIFNCEGGYHYIDDKIECFSGIHIFYMVVCVIFLIILFLLNFIVAMLYNETQPIQEDCLSRLESTFEVALVVYRSIVATFANFCVSDACSWVLIAVFIISSAMLCYQYYKQVPYYNPFVSVFSGSLIFNYFWISINALLMKLVDVNGHLIIIFVGIPLISHLVKSLREKRIENLMKTNIDKLKIDIDALIQVHKMTDFSKGIHKDQSQRMTMIGIVNLHIVECQSQDCPCKAESELFDVASSQFTQRSELAPHLDEVFLNHFIKRLYEDSLNKFINSPSIHIAFAFYHFKVMKNIHASLVELNIAIKKKPTLQQQFTIFRYKNIIEENIKQDHFDHKNIYPELTNVIEFERILGEMQKAIEKVCNLQVEFWTHLTTVVPDLNILNDLGKKLTEASIETEVFWNQLCKINPNYQYALNLYGEYMKDIRNHEHIGTQFIEKAYNSISAKKSIDEHAKTSDALFGDDTTVLHISGNKESIGKILKTSQGLSKVFGYSKTEVIGHSINILMPTLFAKKHTEFMERFFRNGRQVIFYQERILFATHRNGHCFSVKLLVKQMPSLAEGIQYVGMIKPIFADFEYMLTDMDGIIDSFTKGVTGLLGLTPNLFKDKDSQINIQILAPELIQFFLETSSKGRAAKSKYRDAGGDTLTLIVPRDFHTIAKSETKSNLRGASRTRGARGQQNNNSRHRSQVFRQFLKALSKSKKVQRDRMPSTKQLMQQPEYVNYERKKEVMCEITCLDIKASNTDSLKMLVFKFSKYDKTEKKKGNDINLAVGNYNIQEPNMVMNSGYDEFKQISIDGQSKEEVDQVYGISENASMVSPDAVRASYRYSADSSKKVFFEIQKNNSYSNNTNDDQQKIAALANLNQIKNQQQPQVDSNRQMHNSSHQSQSSKQQPLVDSQRINTQQQSNRDNNTVKAISSANNSNEKIIKSQKEENADNSIASIEEIKENYDEDLETPKLDLSGIKLDSAQKEKNSFLEELKKQSFIISENSTQKAEAKESLNIGDKQKNEKKSFDMQLQNKGNNSQSSSLQQMPENMVKKQNFNNMHKRFTGDDEPQEMIQESEEQKSEDSQEEQEEKSEKSLEDSGSKNSSVEEVVNSEDNSVSKSQSKSKHTRSSKKRNDQSESNTHSEVLVDDSDEDEDQKHNNDSNMVSGNFNNNGEAKPLLSQQMKNPYFDQPPNMNDFKKQFEDDKEPRGPFIGSLLGQKPMKKQSQDASSDNNGAPLPNKFSKMGMQKRDTYRIKTNPKYKCVDEGEEDDNDQNNKHAHEDPEALSSKEIDFRETLLKHEKRRKKKEKKQREKEQKKIKALNGDDITPGAPSEGSTKNPTQDEQEEDDSDSSSSSSEESKAGKKGNNKVDSKASTKKAARSNNDEGEISSVTTMQSKTERNHYILRMAIDEKYIPSSIQNLRFAAYFIFLILILLAIVYFVIQTSLFDKINQNIKNIHNSESRLNYIIDITLRTRTLILINQDKLNLNSTEKALLLSETLEDLTASATNLKEAQTNLSLKTATLSDDQLMKINPNDVVMQYLKYPDMPDQYIFSIWEAIMEIVVSAYRLSTLEISKITDDHPTAYFILKNCLNSVLIALKSSTDAIIAESDSSRSFNMSIFLYLLIAASCSLFISLIFMVPVINKVTKNKQEVLELFTHKNIEKHIDDQLKTCRNFVQMKLQQNNGEPEHDIDGDDNGMNVNDKDLQNELNNNKYMKRIKKKNKGKKWKKLNSKFGSTLLKFLLFICIIEGYFLAIYLFSYKFLEEVQDLTQELKLLISRQPVQSFLLLIQKELIYSNGSSMIEGQSSITYVPTYHEQLYDEEEQLLDTFSQNYDYHTGSYNDDFNNIIYSNVCQYVSYDSQSTCETFNQGILKKGIYSSVIKYWDFLRQLNHDFLESNRTNQTIKIFLNEQRLQTAEKMQDYYFKLALSKLVNRLEDDIDTFFEVQYIQNRTIFIIYIIYIVLLYFLIWSKFVKIMQDELWKTKSMLSILPTKLCFEIEEIRYFIYANSSNDSLTTKL